MCAAPGRTLPRAAGFTLIEVTLVMVMLAVAFALIVPALDGLTPKHAVASAAREIAGTIDLVRGTAAGKGQVMAIYYDLAGGTWRIYGPPPEGERGEAPWNLAPIGTRKKLPRYVSFRGIQPQGRPYHQSGELKVRFDPISIEGSHIVHLESDKGHLYSVKYNAFIGQAAIQAGEAEFEDGQ